MSTEGLKLFRAEALEHQRRRLAGEVVISLTARNQWLLGLYLVLLAALLLAASLVTISIPGRCAAPSNRPQAGPPACGQVQRVRPVQMILGRVRMVSADKDPAPARDHR